MCVTVCVSSLALAALCVASAPSLVVKKYSPSTNVSYCIKSVNNVCIVIFKGSIVIYFVGRESVRLLPLDVRNIQLKKNSFLSLYLLTIIN